MGRQIDSQIDRLTDRCVCCFREGTPHPLTRALKRMHHPLNRSSKEAFKRKHHPLKRIFEGARIYHTLWISFKDDAPSPRGKLQRRCTTRMHHLLRKSLKDAVREALKRMHHLLRETPKML